MIPDKLIELCMERIAPYNCEGFVEGEGPEDASLMFIGEAPGATEIETGIPFIGRAGKYLTQFIHYLGCERSDVFITSAVRSRPFKIVEKIDPAGNLIVKRPNRTPTRKELIAHAPLLDYQIKTVNPDIIITLGKTAYQRVTGSNKSLSEIHGKIEHRKILYLNNENKFILSDRTWSIFPAYHPASIFYNRKLLEVIYQDLDKLKQYMKESDL